MRRILLACALISGVLVAPARAAVPHVVQPGETLWSIAAANNLYTGALAAFNGVSPDSQVVLGSTIMVPSTPEALAKVNEELAAGRIAQPSGKVVATPAAATATTPAATPPAASSAPPPAG